MYVCMYVCICMHVVTYSELLQQIPTCPLSLAFKIEALQHVAIATIEHHFVNVQFTEENLEVLDKALKNFLGKLFDLNTNTTVRTMFLKKDKGGLGVRKTILILYSGTNRFFSQHVKPLKRKYLICSRKLTRTRHEGERSS